uniref:Uncharacterized protein n=1 Tax=Anguilla anguilla TaxID=7936 RepID=A0A0E9T8Q6_ANGAN
MTQHWLELARTIRLQERNLTNTNFPLQTSELEFG